MGNDGVGQFLPLARLFRGVDVHGDPKRVGKSEA
jgi:hypothetical protein